LYLCPSSHPPDIIYNLNGISSLPQQPQFFHHRPSKNFKTSASLLPKLAGAFFVATAAKTAHTAQEDGTSEDKDGGGAQG